MFILNGRGLKIEIREKKERAMKVLKNIEGEKVLSLAELVSYNEGQIISRTLVQNRHVSLTLFAFDKGEEISSHSSSGDAMVTVLDGTARITVGDSTYTVRSGQSIAMPADIPHALYAEEPFKMLLIVAFPPQVGQEVKKV
jgi:quercetin dioxygenase-like cupin family protein